MLFVIETISRQRLVSFPLPKTYLKVDLVTRDDPSKEYCAGVGMQNTNIIKLKC